MEVTCAGMSDAEGEGELVCDAVGVVVEEGENEAEGETLGQTSRTGGWAQVSSLRYK